MGATKNVRYMPGSIALAIFLCAIAMLFGLLTFVFAMGVISEPNVTKADVMAISATASGLITTMFVFLAFCALADGRRTINSPPDSESLVD